MSAIFDHFVCILPLNCYSIVNQYFELGTIIIILDFTLFFSSCDTLKKVSNMTALDWKSKNIFLFFCQFMKFRLLLNFFLPPPCKSKTTNENFRKIYQNFHHHIFFWFSRKLLLESMPFQLKNDPQISGKMSTNFQVAFSIRKKKLKKKKIDFFLSSNAAKVSTANS